MDINWDDVTPGKTVFVWDAGYGFQDIEFLIVHIFGESVWATSQRFNVPQHFHKNDFKNCHFKSKWREITEECEFGEWHGRVSLYYENDYVLWDDCFGKDAKFKIDGMRVFTCN